ncbi:MAG: TonB-dependent receptor [Hyphomonadaceae bacterium]|nr:TonB-dependent receptor [Hyphomonadaceae bacterium]
MAQDKGAHVSAAMTICLGIALAISQPAAAEPAPSQPDEIIVTARFRAERDQDVGMALSVVSGAEAQQQGVSSLADIARRIPGVSVVDYGPNKADLGFRGLANVSITTNWQRSSALVGVYLDDVAVATPFNVQRSFNLYDIERVEIARGPQGTLYGEGAMGGSVRYITTDPDLNDIEGRLRTMVSSTQNADGALNWRADAVANLPIVPNRFGVRIGAFQNEEAGFIDYSATNIPALATPNGVPREGANDFREYGVRLVALASPSPRLRVRLSADVEQSHNDAEQTINGAANGLTNSGHFALEPQNDRSTLVSARTDYNFSSGTISSVTGYFQRYREDLGLDPAASFGLGFPATKNLSMDETALSEELRFLSNLTGRLNFVVGAYYKSTNTDVALVDFSAVAGAPGTVLDESESYDAEQMAVFGEFRYRATPRLTATIGARFYRERLSAVQVWRQPDQVFSVIPTTTVSSAVPLDQFLPKLLLEYAASEDLLFYASAARGARNGGVNVTSTVTVAEARGVPGVPRTFDGDSVWSYEMGARSSWLDRRLILNAALYYVAWSDVQVQLSPPSGFRGFGNAGAAHSQGLELESRLELTPALTFSGALSYNDAQFDDGYVDQAALGRTVAAGTRMPNTPDWTAAIALDWRSGFPNWSRAEINANFNAQYVGESEGRARTAPLDPAYYEIDSYTLANARISVDTDNWSVTLFADNILDNNTLLHQVNGSVAPSRLLWTTNRPRTIGLEFNAHF